MNAFVTPFLEGERQNLSRGGPLTLTAEEKLRLSPATIEAIRAAYVPGEFSREAVARKFDMRLVVVKHVLQGRLGSVVAPEDCGWSVDSGSWHVLKRLYDHYRLVLKRDHLDEFRDRVAGGEGERVAARDTRVLWAMNFSFYRTGPVFVVVESLNNQAVTALCPRRYVRREGAWVKRSQLPMQQQSQAMRPSAAGAAQAALQECDFGD